MTMTADTDRPVVTKGTFDSEPTMTRHSFLLGEVALYAPNAPANEWGSLPWRFTTSRGWGGYDDPGLDFIVRPEHYMDAFNHPALIEHNQSWLWPSM